MSTKSLMDTSSRGRRCNRSWPEALKREIVEASLEPGSSVSAVARRYDVNTNQLFSWRKMFRDGLSSGSSPAVPELVPVVVKPEALKPAGPVPAALETVEIEVSGRYRLRVGRGVDAEVLGRVLDVLERR